MSSEGGAQRQHTMLPPEATGARPGARSVFLKVLSAAISGALIVLLFAAIIPKVTEFDSVWTDLASVDPAVIGLMVLMAVAIRILQATAFSSLVPDLSVWRSLIAKEASTAVSNVVPGPSGTASQYVILRSWDVQTERFARVTVAVSIAQYALILVAPGLMFVAWTLIGMPASPGGDNELLFGLIAIALSAVTAVLVIAVARRVRLAGALGRACQACVNPVRRLSGKSPMTNWAERAVTLRADMVEELKLRGVRLLSNVIGGYALNGALLVLCLWACGISWHQLPLTLGVLLYGVGRIATMVQITPGGVGVTEIVYTALFVAVLGDSAHDNVVAGVLIFRALTYLLPIITGAFAYVIWRIIRRREEHEAKVAEAQ